MMFDYKNLSEQGRKCILRETMCASVWSIAAGCTLAFTMEAPGEGVILAVKLICLMVSTANAVSFAKEAAGSMRFMNELKRGLRILENRAPGGDTLTTIYDQQGTKRREKTHDEANRNL